MPDVTLEIDGHVVHVMRGSYVCDGQPTAEAHEFAARLIGRLDEMRAFAAGKLLDLYNDVWREEEDPELDGTGFCSRLTDPSIALYDEVGEAEVCFETSDMFSDHVVRVGISRGQIANASMEG